MVLRFAAPAGRNVGRFRTPVSTPLRSDREYWLRVASPGSCASGEGGAGRSGAILGVPPGHSPPAPEVSEPARKRTRERGRIDEWQSIRPRVWWVSVPA